MMTEAPGGASDPELAEVRFTPKEYSEMWNRIYSAEREVLDVKRSAKADVEKAERAAERKIDETVKDLNRQLSKLRADDEEKMKRREERALKISEDADKKVADALQQAEQAREELKRQRYLNNNLKRIARERANADRGIKPKKEHDGYLVLSSRQWVEHYDHELTEDEYNAKPEEFRNRYRFPYTEHLTAEVWKSIIQTPYDASLPLDQIRGMVEDTDLWDGGILRDIGCTNMANNDTNGVYRSFGKNDKGYEENGLYKWKFVANYKSGFWELEIFTTKSLRVPENRRPKPAGRKSGKKERCAKEGC